ncbi:membrane protein insertase YidC [Candidatus Dependentiae bacterium]|nr:membrane protein insertase YidC [Candidatus Dependentiae bacterium]
MSQSKISIFLESVFSWPVLLSLLFMLGFQWFFPSNTAKDVIAPFLNRDVVCEPFKRTDEENQVWVETPLCEYVFSLEGAILVDQVYKKHLGKDGQPLKTVYEHGQFEKDQGLFLLALEEKTPLNYKLVSQNDLISGVELVFSTETSNKEWRIFKKFHLSNTSYSIDLSILFEPLKNEVQPLSPRVFVSGPLLAELEKDKVEGAVIRGDDQRLEKNVSGKNELLAYWDAPRIVAVEDKYFIHALIEYSPGFVNRAFFKRVAGLGELKKKDVTGSGLVAILECAKVTEKADVKLSLYVGPKSVAEMEKVDSKLTSFLSLGFFSWLAKFFLWLMELLYEYVGNYGLVIIVLTVMVKLLFLPLFIFSKREALKASMLEARYSLELQAIKQKFKDDFVSREAEISKFYDAHGVARNGGAWGLVSNLIFFLIFSTFSAIMNNSLALYHAPFVLWIKNLGAPDPLYILPLLLVAGFVYHQRSMKLFGAGMVIMKIVLPVVFFFVGINFSAGVLIYLATNSLLMIVDELLVKYLFPVVI